MAQRNWLLCMGYSRSSSCRKEQGPVQSGMYNSSWLVVSPLPHITFYIFQTSLGGNTLHIGVEVWDSH